MTAIEYASMSTTALQGLDANSNGLNREASRELHRRALAELTGTGRNPAQLLRQLEARRHGPDCRTPRERYVAMWAKRHVTAHGASPRELYLQLMAKRIAGGW
jgi:hypothetical protein